MAKTFKSFCITVRPKLGLKESTTGALLKWFNKLPHAYAVTEMTCEAMHLHAQIWNTDGWIKGNVMKKLKQICEKTIDDWDTDQNRHCCKVRVAYNDWISTYCTDNEAKIDEPVVILDNAPSNSSNADWYPSEEEQAEVLAEANAKDKLMHAWSVLWEERGEGLPCTHMNVARFCSDVWFRWKLKPTIGDTKRRREFIKTLFFYIRGYADLDNLMCETDYQIGMIIENHEMDNG